HQTRDRGRDVHLKDRPRSVARAQEARRRAARAWLRHATRPRRRLPPEALRAPSSRGETLPTVDRGMSVGWASKPVRKKSTSALPLSLPPGAAPKLDETGKN